MQPLDHAREVTPVAQHALAHAIVDKRLLVVGFCAAWCNTCGEFQTAFDRLAATRSDVAFVWLDIEDDADVTGDVDIENFPTLAIFDRQRLVHFGVSLPQPAIVARLIDSLSAMPPPIVTETTLLALPSRLSSMGAAAAARALRNP